MCLVDFCLIFCFCYFLLFASFLLFLLLFVRRVVEFVVVLCLYVFIFLFSFHINIVDLPFSIYLCSQSIALCCSTRFVSSFARFHRAVAATSSSAQHRLILGPTSIPARTFVPFGSFGSVLLPQISLPFPHLSFSLLSQ